MARKKTADSEPPPPPIPDIDLASIGTLEGDLLRILWDAGEPLSSVQIFEVIYFQRRDRRKEMASPSTIAVTLSRMVDKGLLSVERRPRGGKGYYQPTHTRAETVSTVLNDVARRLAGQPLGYLLTLFSAPGNKASSMADGGRDLSPLVQELRRRAAEDAEPKSAEK